MSEELQFEVTKSVTRPVLKYDADKPVYVTFQGPITKAKPLSKGRSQKDKDGNVIEQEPPYVADVLNLSTKTDSTLICNAVLKSSIEEEYGNESYVGKSFRIIKSKLEGRRYFNFDIAEIKLKSDNAPAPGPASHPAKGRK